MDPPPADAIKLAPKTKHTVLKYKSGYGFTELCTLRVNELVKHRGFEAGHPPYEVHVTDFVVSIERVSEQSNFFEVAFNGSNRSALTGEILEVEGVGVYALNVLLCCMHGFYDHPHGTDLSSTSAAERHSVFLKKFIDNESSGMAILQSASRFSPEEGIVPQPQLLDIFVKATKYQMKQPALQAWLLLHADLHATWYQDLGRREYTKQLVAMACHLKLRSKFSELASAMIHDSKGKITSIVPVQYSEMDLPAFVVEQLESAREMIMKPILKILGPAIGDKSDFPGTNDRDLAEHLTQKLQLYYTDYILSFRRFDRCARDFGGWFSSRIKKDPEHRRWNDLFTRALEGSAYVKNTTVCFKCLSLSIYNSHDEENEIWVTSAGDKTYYGCTADHTLHTWYASFQGPVEFREKLLIRWMNAHRGSEETRQMRELQRYEEAV